VVLSVAASDADGTVMKVAFFDGTNWLGSIANAPFNLRASLGVGAHTLTAPATDNAGAAAGDWTRSVAPGASGVIPLEFTPPDMNGPISKTVRVASNDPDHPKIEIPIVSRDLTALRTRGGRALPVRRQPPGRVGSGASQSGEQTPVPASRQ
jgi:hypothetical protein